MKRINRWLLVAGVAGLACLGANQALAQVVQGGGVGPASAGRGGFGGGNFDPAQFAQQMADGFRDVLEVTNDDEWVVIRSRVQSVLQARIEETMSNVGGMMGMGRFRGRRGGGAMAGFGGRSGNSSPEEEALQKAIDSNASNVQLRAALARFIEARKARQAKLEKAQDDLRKVLSLRQEAIASLSGLL
jgi:hypothetical protein